MNLLNILNPEIAFDGWAIGIIIFVLTLLCSGTYIYATRIKVKQKQKAGKNAQQKQKISSSTLKDESNIVQKQKAGDNAQQKQII